MSPVRSALSIVLALLLHLASQSIVHASQRIVVFAPASMTDVFASIAKTFEAQTSNQLVISFAGTPQLARQLDAGAPVDLFVTADKNWMDWAVGRDLVDKGSIFALAGNTLVLAVQKEGEGAPDIDGLLTKSRFAMADAEAVPAGRYAKQALIHRKIWDQARRQAVFGDNVRTTVRRLARGEVAAAIVYNTDVLVEPSVKVLHSFTEDSHVPIRYWAAATNTGKNKEVIGLLNFLKGEMAGNLLNEAGFVHPVTER